jgi:hypothetical protein
MSRIIAWMCVPRICVLALCWPIGSMGARDESLRALLELEVQQGSHVQHGNATKAPPAGSHGHHGNAASASVKMTSPFWQSHVPYWLGIGQYNAKHCADEPATLIAIKGKFQLPDESNKHMLRSVPVMIPPMVILSTLPCMYYLSSLAERKHLGNFIGTYIGFFIGNVIALRLLVPQDGLFNRWNDTALLLLVAIVGVFFRVIAVALTDRISCDLDSANIKPANVYMNMSRPISQVVPKFIGQSFLMWMYCAHLLDTAHGPKGSFLNCSVAKVQWTCVVMIALPCLQGIVGAGFGREFIARLGPWMALARSPRYKLAGGEQTVTVSLLAIYNRMMMDFLVNQVYRGIVTFTMYSACLFDAYLAFVLNVFAVAFITALDDEADDVSEYCIVCDGTDTLYTLDSAVTDSSVRKNDGGATSQK